MDEHVRELALFAGAGGGLYGSLLLGWTPICAVEKDRYRRAVLLARQRDGIFPRFAIHDDIRTFAGTLLRGRVDVITAGFPCQPFSFAGKRLGADDERNLWPETIRVIRDVRPRLALLENVPGLLSSGEYFGQILGDLAEAGFDAEWDVFSSCSVGAPHTRDRLFLLAYSARELGEKRLGDGQTKQGPLPANGHRANTSEWWMEPFAGIRGISNGVAGRRIRLEALGLGQVPAVVVAAWNLLSSRIHEGAQ